MEKLCKGSILFLFGGTMYFLLELSWRGRSHISMFLLGGLCFLLIGLMNECYFTYEMALIKQMLISSVLVTSLEFLVGLVVNIWLKLGVWDYSNLPLNVLGQICIPFTFLWIFISLLAILADDWLRYKLFKEEKPHYKLF